MSSTSTSSNGNSQWNGIHIPGFNTEIDAEAKYDDAEMYDALVPSELPHVICDVPVSSASLIDVNFCENRELLSVSLPDGYNKIEIISKQNEDRKEQLYSSTGGWATESNLGLYSELDSSNSVEFKLKINTDVIIEFYFSDASKANVKDELSARPQLEVSSLEFPDEATLKDQLGTAADMSYINRANVQIDTNENKVIFELQEPVQEHNRGSFPTEHITSEYMRKSEKNFGGLAMMVAATPLLGSKATTATPWDAKSIGFNNTGEYHDVDDEKYVLKDWDETTDATRDGESIVGKFVDKFKEMVEDVSDTTIVDPSALSPEEKNRRNDRSELANQIAKQGVYGHMKYKSESDNNKIKFYTGMSLRRGYKLNDQDGEENIKVFRVENTFVNSGSTHTATLKVTERGEAGETIAQKEFLLDNTLSIPAGQNYDIVKSSVGNHVYFALLHKVEKEPGVRASYVEPVSSAYVSSVSAEFEGTFVSVHNSISNLVSQSALGYQITAESKLVPDAETVSDLLVQGWFPDRDIIGTSDQYNSLLEIVDNEGNITYEQDTPLFEGNEYNSFDEAMQSNHATPVPGSEDGQIKDTLDAEVKSYNRHYIQFVRDFERARQIALDIIDPTQGDQAKQTGLKAYLKDVLDSKLQIETQLLQNVGDSFMHRGQVTFTIPDEVDIRNIRHDVIKELRSNLWIDGALSYEKGAVSATFPASEVAADVASGKFTLATGSTNSLRRIKYSVPILLRYTKQGPKGTAPKIPASSSPA